MPVTTQPATGNRDIDGLLSGSRWSGTVTFGFPDSASDYPAGYGDEPANGFFSVSYYQQETIRYIFSLVEAYTNLTFSYAGTVTADISFGQTSLADTAYAYYPSSGGDVWFGDDFRNPRVGDYAFLTHLHEIGHALGLSHPHESDNVGGAPLPGWYDWLGYTVMSYRSQAYGPLSYSLPQFHFPTTFMAADIQALQTMYGADFTTNSGGTVYSWSHETGQQFVNGVGQIMPGSGSGYFGDGASNHVMMTVWDGGGIDTYDFSNYGLGAAYPQGLNISLAPGAEIRLENGSVFNSFLFNSDPRSLIENAIGTVNDDHVAGNDADNWLDGRAGDDHLNGGLGNDRLEGGDGNDTIDAGLGDDLIDAGPGNDTIAAGRGSDFISGGAGFDTIRGNLGSDTVSFDFNFLDALIRFLPDGAIYVGSADGFTIVRSVEFLAFADGTIAVESIRPADTTAPTANLVQDNLVVTPPGEVPQSWQGVAIQFSEEVTLGTGNVRIYYSDGTLYRTYSANELFSDGDTLFVPYPTDAGQYYVEVDAGAVVDTSGNPFAGISGPNEWNYFIGVRSDDYPSQWGPHSGQLIVNGPAIGGYLGDDYDEDTFRVALTAGQMYEFRVDASGPNGANDAAFEVFDSSGSNYSYTQVGNSIFFIAPSSTTFYVRVASNYWSQAETAGSYSVSVHDASDDHAGDQSTTSVVEVGSSIAGIAHGQQDHDWIRVELVAGQSYRFTVTSGSDAANGLPDAEELFLQLLNEDGSVVMIPLPGGYGTSALTDGQLLFTADRTGTFYIRVNNNDYSNSGEHFSGNYTVSVEQGSYSQPQLLSTVAEGGADPAPYADIILTFDQAIFAGEGVIRINAGSSIDGSTSVLEIDINDSSQVQIQGNVVRINPSVDLPAGTHPLRLVHDIAGTSTGSIGNINWIRFSGP